MIYNKLKIFSQNVRKNTLTVNTILETHCHFDIILIQEPPWSIICSISSSTCSEGEVLVGAPHHPNWLSFARPPVTQLDFPRVLAYINICLSSFHFSLCRDIINHRDILLISFFTNNICSSIMNIYSDTSHSALKYLKNTEVNINNLLIMTSDFNIRDWLWNPSFPHHSSILADLSNLDLLLSTNPVLTRYSNTIGKSDLVIDLMFLCSGSNELNNHAIHLDWRLTSDHAPLTITITIEEEFVQTAKLSLPKKSNKKEAFIKEVSSIIKSLDTSSLLNQESLELVVNLLVARIEQVWNANTGKVNITKHSKKWWNGDCNRSLNKYRESRSLEDWKSFKKIVKTTKRSFFDIKIQEIADKSQGPWKLMNWVNKRKLPAMEAIKYDNQPCLSLDSLWNTLHSSFNTALHCQVDISILDEIRNKQVTAWAPFSKEEFKIALESCKNSSTPGLDKLSWNHLKIILIDDVCITNIIKIANTCIDLGYWPNHFKRSSTVIILKPNKLSYNSHKSFRPIVLLNTLSKLIKKVIGERIQFHIVANNFIHPSQLGGLKFKSTIDTDIALMHIIQSGWTKNLLISTLAFDIVQFFPSLNH